MKVTSLPGYDKSIIKNYVENCPEFFKYKNSKDLEYDTFDGKLLWFNVPKEVRFKDMYDTWYIQKVMLINEKHSYLLALNVLDTKVGVIDDDLEKLINLGKEYMRDEELLGIIRTMRPSIKEIAEQLHEHVTTGQPLPKSTQTKH